MNRILVGMGALALLGGAYASSADVMVMEDGRHIRGELVSVNRGQVIFDEMRPGSTSKHRLRVTKDEVARIVLRENAVNDAADDGAFGGPSHEGTYRGPAREGTHRPPSREGTYPEADRDRDRDEDTDSGPFGPDRDSGSVTDPPDLDEPAAVPSGRAVTVSARQAWTDTGMDVAIGDIIRFSASGTVTWSPGQSDGPAGEMNSPINDRRPVPARPAGALIGRIGTAPSDVFFIGDDRGGFRVRTAGRLYLGVNDHSFVDNTGSFQVRVSR